MTLSREAAQNKVTISTVGLGQDVNRAYLEKIAAFAKGKVWLRASRSKASSLISPWK